MFVAIDGGLIQEFQGILQASGIINQEKVTLYSLTYNQIKYKPIYTPNSPPKHNIQTTI